MSKEKFEFTDVQYEKMLEHLAQRNHIVRQERLAKFAATASIAPSSGRVRISAKTLHALQNKGHSLGAGILKIGHSLWSLEREGNEMYLKRVKQEIAFLEDLGLE